MFRILLNKCEKSLISKPKGKIRVRDMSLEKRHERESHVILSSGSAGWLSLFGKGKGDSSIYRGITLLSVSAKCSLICYWWKFSPRFWRTKDLKSLGSRLASQQLTASWYLRVLVERRLVFRKGLLEPYVDLKEAFDYASWDTVGYFTCPWDSCNGYWPDD